MFEFKKEISLLSDENRDYLGLASDGRQTYVSTSDRQMLILDKNCACIDQLPTYGIYHSFCYDESRGCFWAASKEDPETLFLLSKNFEETGTVVLSQDEVWGEVSHLFYNKEEKKMFGAMGNRICQLDITGTPCTRLDLRGKEGILIGFCIYNPYVLCLFETEETQYLQLISFQGELVEEQVLPENRRIVGMLSLLDDCKLTSLCVRFLAKGKDGCVCIIEYLPRVGFLQRKEQRNVECSAVQAQQLYGMKMPEDDMLYSGFDSFDECDSCNTCKHHCSGVSCSQACADVIESIALTETALAHILNAEGEKLQKAIACACNVSELLMVNESVLKTIVHSTQLEQMLYNKLDAVLRGDCCECPCCSKKIKKC